MFKENKSKDKKLKWWQHDYETENNGAQRLSDYYAGTLRYFIRFFPLALLLFYCVGAYQQPDDPLVPVFLKEIIYKLKEGLK